MHNGGRGGGGNTAEHRKVMVVADPTRESAAALRYVLSHVGLGNDTLYLLHVECPAFWKNGLLYFKKPTPGAAPAPAPPPAPREGGMGFGISGCIGGNIDFLEQMKQACEVMNPKLKVKVLKVEMDGKEKANVILSQSILHEIDLLVVGKRQSLSNAILRHGIVKGETAEYLLENSKCTCVAVQRKSQNGGYLLHTKSHRNYWLLA
ncbi:hypothetical protein OSB04_024425 [Centaurea solstitialis]|uniref:UspA domain-containing protein n=1 Tax=Centaurea solstitialis TaxID=347529 RepID=A0AA38T5L0_9ASTR|nr:hypothetical protein OSB04_024425 [Centaurea solstitialis]